MEAVDEAINWLDENPEARADKIKEQKQAVEDIATPIVSSLYAGGTYQEDDDLDEDDDHDEL